MPLRRGTGVGVDEVTAKIGEGGMGEANGAETRAHVPLASSKGCQITSQRLHVMEHRLTVAARACGLATILTFLDATGFLTK